MAAKHSSWPLLERMKRLNEREHMRIASDHLVKLAKAAELENEAVKKELVNLKADLAELVRRHCE